MALIGKLRPLGVYLSRNCDHNVKCFLEGNVKQQIVKSKFPFIGRFMSTEASVVNVDINQLQTLQGNPNATIIDVREVSEIQETGKLPGSTNIPLGNVGAALQESPDEFQKKYSIKKPSVDNPLVFSCRSGRRSMMAAETAASLGYKKVYNYSGGWLDWIEHFPKE